LSAARSSKEWSLQNLKTESQRITAKEKQEGGLTQGQATTLARNEQVGRLGWGWLHEPRGHPPRRPAASLAPAARHAYGSHVKCTARSRAGVVARPPCDCAASAKPCRPSHVRCCADRGAQAMQRFEEELEDLEESLKESIRDALVAKVRRRGARHALRLRCGWARMKAGLGLCDGLQPAGLWLGSAGLACQGAWWRTPQKREAEAAADGGARKRKRRADSDDEGSQSDEDDAFFDRTAGMAAFMRCGLVRTPERVAVRS
jgi:hypothetical protein